MKVKSDHRSKFSNLSNWKEEAWKYQGFGRLNSKDSRRMMTRATQKEQATTTLKTKIIEHLPNVLAA